MSSFQDASWLRRLWALARPGDPATDYVTNVQLVNDRRYASSREAAPYASHGALAVAGGAGIHNFVEIGGFDRLAATQNFLHRARFEILVNMATSLDGLLQVSLTDGSTITTATRVATTPLLGDSDPDVTCRLFIGTIATANIPASAIALPRSATLGLTGATPAFGSSITDLDPTELGFAQTWIGPRNLMFFAPANTSILWKATWQAMRA